MLQVALKQPARRLRAASERLPNWLRAASLLTAWLSAVLVRFVIDTPLAPLAVVVFVAMSVFALWAHIPAMRFDGPLPFSDLGLHVGGEVHPWEDVVRIEPLGDKDLQAVLADGRFVHLRVRGQRTREEFRDSLAHHRPGTIRF